MRAEFDLQGEDRCEELPLSRASDFPAIAAALAAWRASGGDPFPARIDPLTLPRSLLPYVLLLDLELRPRPTLRVRLAGTAVCDWHGYELRGRTAHELFDGRASEAIVAGALAVAASGRPTLARRSLLFESGCLRRYTRLMAPLSRHGQAADGFFKVFDPTSLAVTRLSQSA